MDIVNRLIGDLFLRRAKIVGDNLMACCPNPDHRDDAPSFGVNVINQAYNCFGCDFAGQGFENLYKRLDRSFADDIKQLVFKKVRLPAKKKVKLHVRDTWLPILTQNKPLAIKKMGLRGVSAEIVEQFRIGYNAKKDILFFPIFDQTSGSLISWVERSKNYDCRYLIMPQGTVKERLLYGEYYIQEGIQNDVYLVEGVVDCLKLWTWGFKAVAALGSVLLPAQARRLIDLADNVCVVPDNDKAGAKFKKSAVKLLGGHVILTEIVLPDRINDVGDLECTVDVFKDLSPVILA